MVRTRSTRQLLRVIIRQVHRPSNRVIAAVVYQGKLRARSNAKKISYMNARIQALKYLVDFTLLSFLHYPKFQTNVSRLEKYHVILIP